MGWPVRLRVLFSLKGTIGIISLSNILRAFGHDLFHSFRPKFYQALGASIPAIGMLESMEESVEIFSMGMGGYLADLVGRKAVLVGFGCLSVISYILFILSPSWPWLIPAILLYGLTFTGWAIARESMIADVLPRDGRGAGYGIVYFLTALCTIPAAPLGAVLIGMYGMLTGVRICFALAVLLYLPALGLIAARLREAGKRRCPAWPGVKSMYKFLKEIPRPVGVLIAALCLSTFGMAMSWPYVIFYTMDVVGISAIEWGLLTMVGNVVAGLIKLPGGYLADKLGRKPLILTMMGLSALWLGLIVLARSFLHLLAIFCLMGLRTIGRPSINAFIADRTPISRRARVIGLTSAIQHIFWVPAPLLGAALYVVAPGLTFIGASLVSLTSFMLIWGLI